MLAQLMMLSLVLMQVHAFPNGGGREGGAVMQETKHKCTGLTPLDACSRYVAIPKALFEEEAEAEEAVTQSAVTEMKKYKARQAPDDSCLAIYRMSTPINDKLMFTYYADQDISKGGKQKKAVIVQHGASRNADGYYCQMAKLMMKGEELDPDVLVIAPSIVYDGDKAVEDSDAVWHGGIAESIETFNDWKAGGLSSGSPGISSFDVFDTITNTVLDKALYPNMESVVWIGHSAGGQAVQRYALTTKIGVSDTLRYGVANPSSYAYLNASRVKYTAGTATCSKKECAFSDKPTFSPTASKLANPAAEHFKGFVCDNKLIPYDQWPYGISNLAGLPYATGRSVPKMVADYEKRNVKYFVGGADACNDHQFTLPNGKTWCNKKCWNYNHPHFSKKFCARTAMDMRCPAMLEGPWRKARGQMYAKFVSAFYGKPTHGLSIVPGVGHEGGKMLGSEAALAFIGK